MQGPGKAGPGLTPSTSAQETVLQEPGRHLPQCRGELEPRGLQHRLETHQLMPLPGARRLDLITPSLVTPTARAARHLPIRWRREVCGGQEARELHSEGLKLRGQEVLEGVGCMELRMARVTAPHGLLEGREEGLA